MNKFYSLTDNICLDSETELRATHLHNSISARIQKMGEHLSDTNFVGISVGVAT